MTEEFSKIQVVQTIIKTLSLEELQNECKRNQGDRSSEGKCFYEYKEGDQIPEDMEKDEVWQNAPSWNGKYQASNYGRIRIKNYDNGLYEIAEQINHPDLGKGWLVLEKFPSVLVYLIVADAWLEKAEPGWPVHHINNDGFDNRPENLVYVSQDVHNKIHHITENLL